MSDRLNRKIAALIGVTALVGALPCLFELQTYDTFFHLAAGRQILDTGSLSDADTFSFTFRGAIWHNHSHLFQVAIAGIERVAGYAGLSLFQWVSAALMIGIALLSSVRSGTSHPVAAVLCMIPVALFHEVVVPRPHLFGFLLLEICLALVLFAERMDRPRTLFWLPLCYLVWLGSHGSNVVQLGVMGVCFFGAVLGRRRSFYIVYGIDLLVCISAALLLKPSAFLQAGAHFDSAFLFAEIPEWRGFSLATLFGTVKGIGLMAVWTLSLAGLLIRARLLTIQGHPVSRTDRLASHHAVLLAGFMILALTSFRMAPLFLFGAAPLWIPTAAWVLQSAAKEAVHRAHAHLSETAWRWVPNIAAALLCTGIAAATIHFDGSHVFGVGLESGRFPEAAVAELDRLGIGKRLYAAYNWGGYLMVARTSPSDGVFVDGRAITLYPSRFLERFVGAYTDPTLFENLAEQYAVDSVLLPVKSNRTGLLRRYLDGSPKWQCIFFDTVSAVYVLRDAPPRE
jgi:hypothetical protein